MYYLFNDIYQDYYQILLYHFQVYIILNKYNSENKNNFPGSLLVFITLFLISSLSILHYHNAEHYFTIISASPYIFFKLTLTVSFLFALM